MVYVKEYWNDGNNRAEIARNHTNEMKKKYGVEIEDSVKRTVIYDTAFKSHKNTKNGTSRIIVEDKDSVSAICEYAEGKTAVLNFSSYKYPGGMFLEGSKAQEECLCHESFLFNVLSRFKIDFYDWNIRNKNKELYLNRGMYSPDIAFEHGTSAITCDVITCAAPNKGSAVKYHNVLEFENTEALKSRINYVLDIAKENNVNTLILGAYGCGVFGQDATEVAQIFKELIETEYKCFDMIVFAVPNGRDGNYKKIANVFGAI